MLATTRRSLSPIIATAKFTDVDAFGIFERSVQEESAHCGASLFSILDSSIMGKGKTSTADNEDSGIGVSEDKVSQCTTSWERALESQEQTYKNEIEDLREDHAAEVEELNNTISKLQADAKAVSDRKAYIEKIAKKNADKKDAELVRQKALLEAANAEISTKDTTIQEQGMKIDYLKRVSSNSRSRIAELQELHCDTQQWEVMPLQQEVARLTSVNVDQQKYINVQTTQLFNLQSQIQNQPIIAQLHAQSKIHKAQYEHTQRLYHNTIHELVKAKDQLNAQHVRLCQYHEEHEDDAKTDRLLQKDEQYQLLEKKANETFLLWKKGNESHKNEKILFGATIEELRTRIDNMEGGINFLQDENARLTFIIEEYIKVQTENMDLVLMELYDASKKTVNALKEKLGNQNIQLANVEKDLSEQRAEVKLRDLMLEKKEAEVRTLAEEKIDAERAVENMESMVEFREANLKNELENKDNELEIANARIEELLLSPSGIEARYRLEISKLHQHIDGMRAAERQRAVEKHSRDFHETSCAQVNALTWKVHAKNWENAQLEIIDLKKRIQLMNQGCDPEKFELAQKYEELKEERDFLEQKLFEKMEVMTETLEKHVAATKAKARATQEEMRYMGEVAGNLCQYLKDAWSADFLAEELSPEERQNRLTLLENVEDGIHRMMAGLLVHEDEAEEVGQAEEITIHDNNDDPRRATNKDDTVERRDDDIIPLHILASQLSDPWPFIRGNQTSQPSTPSSANRSGQTFTADYTTSSSEYQTAMSENGMPPHSNNHRQFSPPQDHQPTHRHLNVEAELISPLAFQIQQSNLPIQQGWTVTSPGLNHEYIYADDTAHDHYHHHTHPYGYDGPFDDDSIAVNEDEDVPSAGQDFEIYCDDDAGPSTAEENITPPNVLTTLSTTTDQFDPDEILPEHVLRYSRGRYFTYGDYAQYWGSVEGGIGDVIDYWAVSTEEDDPIEACLTDVPGYMEVNLMSGALPVEEEGEGSKGDMAVEDGEGLEEGESEVEIIV